MAKPKTEPAAPAVKDSYVHAACNGETQIDKALVDAKARKLYCSHCRGLFAASEFTWS